MFEQMRTWQLSIMKKTYFDGRFIIFFLGALLILNTA